MQSLQVGPGAAAQSDVETAHAQLRCPLSQSVAMGKDRIVFAKIDTGKNAERGFDFRHGATGVRGEICECCSLGALGQAEQQLQSQFGKQAIGLAIQTSPLKRLLNWQTISAVAGNSVEHNLFTNRDNWLETMHVKSSCQLEFALQIRLTRTAYLPIFRQMKSIRSLVWIGCAFPLSVAAFARRSRMVPARFRTKCAPLIPRRARYKACSGWRRWADVPSQRPQR